MLAVGGRMTYSTCSFNPIENEAVVQAALVHFKGKIKLVDVSKQVSPHLKYRPGLKQWTVYHKPRGKYHP
jgi:16S rRNA C967 or C1407 C5-methylase (RsmB/RsmF family)